jgi:hypothetical protein
MDALAFPPCRHRGEEISPGVRRCHSPKLAGLKLVEPEVCADCYCRDHDTPPGPPPEPVHLVPCVHLGPETGERVPAPGRSPAADLAVHECSHPGHDRTTTAACGHCKDYLFPVVTPRTPVEAVQRLLLLPPRPQPSGWWSWPNVQEAHRRAATDFIGRIAPYPGTHSGRGVVIAGGGKYFAAAYVAVRVLRHVGCTLPVHLWHLGGEVDDAMRELLRPHGVTCVDAEEVARVHPYRFLPDHWWRGWQLKPYAVAHSPFREVLFLDADCYPARDPSFLFDRPGYRAAGAVFWPDLVGSLGLFTPDRWALFGLEPADRIPFESGQMVINKEACWRELNLTLHYNAQADYTYHVLWGDKDTFLVAWRRLGRDYAMLWPECGWDLHTIVQKDDRGEPLFLHRCRDKWRLRPERFDSSPQPGPLNRHNPRLAHEDFCFGVLRELERLWPAGRGDCQ